MKNTRKNPEIPQQFCLTHLEAARLYLQKEFATFPLNRYAEGGNGERGKKPPIRANRDLTQSHISLQLIYKYRGDIEPVNVGLKLYGDHVVVDLDPKGDEGASAYAFVERRVEPDRIPDDDQPPTFYEELDDAVRFFAGKDGLEALDEVEGGLAR